MTAKVFHLNRKSNQKNDSISLLPFFVTISKLWEEYKRKQDELTQRKMKFLEEQAYNNLYEQYLIFHTERIANSVDINPSIYAEKDARAKAKEIVLQVAAKGRINQCYRARVKELRKG